MPALYCCSCSICWLLFSYVWCTVLSISVKKCRCKINHKWEVLLTWEKLVWLIHTAWTTSMYISYVIHHLFSIDWLMNERMYENMIISYGMWCYRQVLLLDNSLVLNHIISRRINVLKYKTFGNQRYAIVHHNCNESYEINNHNSIYNNDYEVISIYSSLCTCLPPFIIEMLLLVDIPIISAINHNTDGLKTVFVITWTLYYVSIVFMYRFHDSSYWLSSWWFTM